jgi:hypothetical protein
MVSSGEKILYREDAKNPGNIQRSPDCSTTTLTTLAPWRFKGLGPGQEGRGCGMRVSGIIAGDGKLVKNGGRADSHG